MRNGASATIASARDEMIPIDCVRHYIAHEDPATRVANLIAMVVGANGPLYPVYMIVLIGRSVGIVTSMGWADPEEEGSLPG